jgi:hypothetical protein
MWSILHKRLLKIHDRSQHLLYPLCELINGLALASPIRLLLHGEVIDQSFQIGKPLPIVVRGSDSIS